MPNELNEGSLVESLYHPELGRGIVMEVRERKQRRFATNPEEPNRWLIATVYWPEAREDSVEPGYSLKVL
jgi:hypothetical protein